MQGLAKIIDEYENLETLIEINGFPDRNELYFSVMLREREFNYFAGVIERHFLSDLGFGIRIPFDGLSVNAEVQTLMAAEYGIALPTEAEFKSGLPCLYPNTETHFSFFRSSA